MAIRSVWARRPCLIFMSRATSAGPRARAWSSLWWRQPISWTDPGSRCYPRGKELDFQAFFQAASSLEKGFEFRYVVYKDLRERGYYVQPGRPDFRVYPRGGHPGKSPAEFYVLVISERMPLPLQEIMQPVEGRGPDEKEADAGHSR